MKTVSTDLSTHIESEVTTLATCWQIARADGITLRFTDHDEDVIISGWTGAEAVLNGTYEANSSYIRTALETSSDFAVDNMNVQGVLESAALTDADLRNGLYDGATVYLFYVNWQDTTQGPLKLRYGNNGQVQIKDYYYESELRGLTQRLTKHVVEQYSALCRAVLGDSRCTVDIDVLKQTGTVSSVIDARTFSATGIGASKEYFASGYILWLTGANAGVKMDVKSQTAGVISPVTAAALALWLPMVYDVQVGDTFYIYPGCDQTAATCKAKFSNLVNFRGEPFVPTSDQVISYPDDKTQVLD